MTLDPFLDAAGRPRIVRGVGLYSGAPRLAELAARIGFETAWIEMEHGPTGFAEAESICLALEAAGAFGTVRVADSERASILRALEIGARIVVVPMVEDATVAADIVRFGKFPPLGARGFNTRSRGLGYGLGPAREAFAAANAGTHLFAQIESKRAVAAVRRICEVEGLSGILIGPGDLSVSMGYAGDMSDPALVRAVVGAVRAARSLGKHAGILVSEGPMLEAALEAGCDLVFSGGDVTSLVEPWRRLLGVLGRARRSVTGGTRSSARRGPATSASRGRPR